MTRFGIRRFVAPTLVVLVLAGIGAGLAIADRSATNRDNFKYAIGMWGDLPYSAVQENPGLPNLIADMNDQKLEFSVHNGDLKAGNGPTANPPSVLCDDALYARAVGWFNSLDDPAIFTPGDNDWTDCDRPGNGGYNSLERLDHERSVFFSTPYSLGKKRLKQEVQATPLCLGVSGPTACVENRRWTFKDVTYATINAQGSCNNLCDTAPDPAEFAARNTAGIAWLEATFDEAVAEESAAVLIVIQANPGFDMSDTRAPLRDPRTLAEANAATDGFRQFLLALRERTIAFRRPVVLVHGDSHYFRIDKPLQDTQGRRLENFTRLETFGDNPAAGLNDVQWVKVLVDPKSRDVFAFQPQIVPGNRVAVPAP